jgi:predicted PurR-regulated permease PerM
VAEVAKWLAGAFANFGFMLALAAFMLVESIGLPEKVRQISAPSRRVHLDKFVDGVRSYVVVTAWVNFLVGAVNTVLLLIMGIPYAALWGVLAFLFGFIPSVGFLLSLIGPALMALLESGPQAALIVIVAFIVINGGIQNIILPRRMGEGTDLSTAVVFGSLLFWGFVLGPVGAILSVPMTMIVRLALDSSDGTRGLSYLMSSGRHPYIPTDTVLEEAAA